MLLLFDIKVLDFLVCDFIVHFDVYLDWFWYQQEKFPGVSQFWTSLKISSWQP